MKILKLVSENVKKLTVVSITPDGNLVQITGKNGQGKTSVLDSIWWALVGGTAQEMPIRNGEKSAKISLTLGDGEKAELLVERRFTDAGNYLKVTTADGMKPTKPQTFLDSIVGALSFEPIGFMKAKTDGKFEMLRSLVKLKVDPAETDRLNKIDYDARTAFNREAKQYRTQAEVIKVPEKLPEPVDETGIFNEMQEAAKNNEALVQRRMARENEITEVGRLVDRAKKLRDNAAAALAEADVVEKNAAERTAALEAEPPIPDPVNLGDLGERMNAAKAANAILVAHRRRKALEVDAGRAEKKAAELTTAMDSRDAELAAAMAEASATLPVEGLAIAKGAVLYKGIPIDQASDAQQLMISTQIAAALNPKLRVIRIRDGSLLDDDAMKWLGQFAEEKDCQIWVERVDSSGSVGFVMEDGHVKGQEAKAAE